MLHTGHISQNELRGHRLLLIRPCSTEVSVIRADAFRDTELETDMKGDTDWLCWGDFVLGLSKGDITPFCYRNNLWPHAALRVEKSLPSAGLLDVQCGTVQRLYETNTPLQQQERILPSSLSLFSEGIFIHSRLWCSSELLHKIQLCTDSHFKGMRDKV